MGNDFSEKSEIGDWWACNDFRFFTPLRCVQNDRRMKALGSK